MFSPFTGLLFDPERVPPTSGAASSPPYDVIDDEDRRQLLARSPYNVVRLLLSEPGDERYQEAAALLASWRQREVLRPDSGPRFYAYEMEYRQPDGALTTARGVVGALHVEPPGRQVLPHEETMAKHRADRMAVLTATRANVDLIVALSASPDFGDLLMPIAEPRIDFSVDGVRHRLATISDPEQIAAVSGAVADHPISIADGHHRYTTALAYREMQEARGEQGPWTHIMAMVAPARGSGLRVAPYHRVFAGVALDTSALDSGFAVAETEPAAPEEPGALVIASAETAFSLRARSDSLQRLPVSLQAASTAVAREVLYPLIGVDEDAATYTPDDSRAVSEAAATGGFAVLMAPVSERAISDASRAGLRFPQKSTYFTPKPRAGLVMRVFDIP